MPMDCVFPWVYNLATKNLHLAASFYRLVTKWELEDFLFWAQDDTNFVP